MNEQKDIEIEVEENVNAYNPRNKIVAAKENIYDRMNISVRTVDFFIGGCVLLTIAIIAIAVVF